MTHIIAYDIEDNKIRTKLAHYLETKGIRLQKSVFAVKIEQNVFEKFLDQILKITKKKGKVMVFRLCAGCEKNAIQFGIIEKDFYVF